MKYSFKKGERLTSRKSVALLFKSGRRTEAYPLRILYDLNNEGRFPCLMAVSVPKRLFKRAVDRNLLKRRIRETYRQQKAGLYAKLNTENVKIRMVIQYRAGKIADFGTIEKSLEQLLGKITAKISGKVSG
ncbi:MAG: ribonuclease P protein component [Bacteroidota bacterium]